MYRTTLGSMFGSGLGNSFFLGITLVPKRFPALRAHSFLKISLRCREFRFDPGEFICRTLEFSQQRTENFYSFNTVPKHDCLVKDDPHAGERGLQLIRGYNGLPRRNGGLQRRYLVPQTLGVSPQNGGSLKLRDRGREPLCVLPCPLGALQRHDFPANSADVDPECGGAGKRRYWLGEPSSVGVRLGSLLREGNKAVILF